MNLEDEEKINILYALAQNESFMLVVSDWFEGDEKAGADAYQESESLVRGYMSEIRRIKPSFNQPISYLYYALLDGYHNMAHLFKGQILDDVMLSKIRFDNSWMTVQHRMQDPKGEVSRLRYDNGDAYALGLIAENLAYNLLSASFKRINNWLDVEYQTELTEDLEASHADIYLKCEECARSLVRMCKRLDEGRAPSFVSCDALFRAARFNTDRFNVIDNPLFVELRKMFLTHMAISPNVSKHEYEKALSAFDSNRLSTETEIGEQK